MDPDRGQRANRRLDPHLSGTPGFRARIVRWIERPNDTPFDGAASAWALSPPGGEDIQETDDGLYPFVFDSPDLARFKAPELPAIVDLQVAAIPHQITVHVDTAAFRASGSMFADESFIPSGTFTPGGARTEPPTAMAILAGRVLAAEEHANPYGGGRFQRLRVRTLGGELDVAGDPRVLPETPAPGSIVSGSFWLSARIAGNPQPPPPRARTRRDLLGRLRRS